MTIVEWLRSRTPPAPDALVARVEDALGPDAADGVDDAPERLMDAAVRLLQPLLARERAGRESAVDLLAADALVTYAFEAASSEPERLDTRTRDAMLRLAQLGPGAGDHLPARG